MSPRDDGGPAYPTQPIYHHPERGTTVVTQGGMSLRDAFAIAALPALVAKEIPAPEPYCSNLGNHDTRVAYAAYRYADAMLAERAK